MSAKNLKVKSAAAALHAQCPDGWKAEPPQVGSCMFGEEWKDGNDDRRMFVRYTREDVTVVLNLAPIGTDRWSQFARDRAYMGVQVEGDTLLNGGSFIRRGIDCSCCSLHTAKEEQRAECHAYGDLQALLDAQWERCQKVKARRATAVPVPGLPHTVQPAWFEATAATLRAGKSVSLLPHGMGTGYALSMRRDNRWDKRADAALESKLGVTPVFVRQLDCD